MRGDPSFIPALKYRWLTPFYDFLVASTIRESTFKRHLVAQAGIASGQRVLDVGCGTATLTLLIKHTHPDAEVTGIDADAQILQRAHQKVAGSGLNVTLAQGMSTRLPYADDSFDRVLSSLLFHHLTREQKLQTLHEVHRVLRPGGELHVADWGKARNLLMRGAYLAVQMLDGFDTTTDNVRDKLPVYMRQAGFIQVQETSQFTTLFGSLSLYRASKR